MVQVGGEADNLASDTNMSETANKIDERLKTRVKVKAGPHMVGVTFVRRNAAESDEPLQPHERNHDLQDMNGLPLIDHVNVTGPYNPTGPGDTPSRAPHLRLQARAAPPRKRLRPDDPDRRSPAAPTAGRSTDDDMAPMLALYARGPGEGQLRAGHRAGPAAGPRQSEVPLPDGNAAAGAARPRRCQRSRAGVAAVVLPLELDSRRHAADAGGAEPPAASRRCSSSRCGGCWRIREVARARGQLRRPVADAAQPEGPHPDARATSRTSTTSCARRSARKRSCSSRASSARIAACSTC